MRAIPFKLYGDTWKAYIVSHDKFMSLHGDDCEAITIIEDKKIVFNDEDLSLHVVVHELVHAYFSYQYIDSSNLSVLQTEEIFAELFGHKGEELLRLAKKLHKELDRQ